MITLSLGKQSNVILHKIVSICQRLEKQNLRNTGWSYPSFIPTIPMDLLLFKTTYPFPFLESLDLTRPCVEAAQLKLWKISLVVWPNIMIFVVKNPRISPKSSPNPTLAKLSCPVPLVPTHGLLKPDSQMV